MILLLTTALSNYPESLYLDMVDALMAACIWLPLALRARFPTFYMVESALASPTTTVATVHVMDLLMDERQRSYDKFFR